MAGHSLGEACTELGEVIGVGLIGWYRPGANRPGFFCVGKDR